MTANLMAAEVRLTQDRPVDGMKNPYRTRWFEHDGVVFKVEAKQLNGIWEVAPDDDLIRDLAYGPVRIGSPQVEHRVRDEYTHKLLRGGALSAYYGSSEYVVAFKMRLSDARKQIAEWVNSPEWPAIRDAYRALRADLES